MVSVSIFLHNMLLVQMQELKGLCRRKQHEPHHGPFHQLQSESNIALKFKFKEWDYGWKGFRLSEEEGNWRLVQRVSRYCMHNFLKRDLQLLHRIWPAQKVLHNHMIKGEEGHQNLAHSNKNINPTNLPSAICILSVMNRRGLETLSAKASSISSILLIQINNTNIYNRLMMVIYIHMITK